MSGPHDSLQHSFESVWLVVNSRRHGPMPYGTALTRMAALRSDGVDLGHMNLTAARAVRRAL
jgi:hypothetical protein